MSVPQKKYTCAKASVGDEADIFRLGHGMLDIAQFVYTFNTIRDIVRIHDPNVKDSKYEESASGRGFFDWFGPPPPKQVEFKNPELIITDSGMQQKHPDRNFSYSVTPEAIMKFFSLDNEFNRKYFKLDGGDIKFDESESLDNTDFEFLRDMQMNIDLKQDVEIIDYDDAFSTSEGGLTCGLLVNHTKKWLCVVFRGTIGTKDWGHNLNFDLNHKDMFPDHAAFTGADEDKPATHTGFTDYLVTPRPLDPNEKSYLKRLVSSIDWAFDPDDKLDDEATNPKPKITKEYGIYVTGHSLGGGLANLFSYHLADLKSRNDPSAQHIPSQIKAITFAAPLIGNEAFGKKYQELEKKGFLRHIRVSNDGDVVPGIVPGWIKWVPVIGKHCKLDDAHKFRANGVNLSFAEKGILELGYGASATHTAMSQFNINALSIHGLDVYQSRLEEAEEKYPSNKTVEQIYKEEAGDFTG